ncbi:hypothetical protein NUW58_g10925 [Xylaria curta]|uniref:Uncharacterized protein n=1 Tax=Xylaria curta TaxID=42375 RepID=A0ACC1MEY6_9PEZI|nr:hypothetical protein NUW58_g10925 [Xylaria curta]
MYAGGGMYERMRQDDAVENERDGEVKTEDNNNVEIKDETPEPESELESVSDLMSGPMHAADADDEEGY